jgi:hypothetical protein
VIEPPHHAGAPITQWTAAPPSALIEARFGVRRGGRLVSGARRSGDHRVTTSGIHSAGGLVTAVREFSVAVRESA